MDMRAAITNVQIGKDIGLDHTTVSRIRSGERLPSIDVMVDVELRYGWRVEQQIKSRLDGTYAEDLETKLVKMFGVAEPVATPS